MRQVFPRAGSSRGHPATAMCVTLKAFFFFKEKERTDCYRLPTARTLHNAQPTTMLRKTKSKRHTQDPTNKL
jgi:hypothetical protein